MRIRITALITVLILILSSCAYDNVPGSASLKASPKNNLDIHFIDVGQGDCILITNNDTAILIDAGPAESAWTICSYLENKKINHLDCFIATHPHEDHLGAAWAVLSSVKTDNVYINSDTSSSYFYERFVDVLLEENIPVSYAKTDCIYEYGNLRMKFISPTMDFGNLNDNSLVTKFTYGDITALFMGDAERGVEDELIKEGVDIKADLLKVGHHGSRYGSSAQFLNMVLPTVSVIQCGKDNSYSHPHKEVLDRIFSIGSDLLRCDEDGTIVLSTDGKSIYDASGKAIKKNMSTAQLPLVYIGNKKSKVFHLETCPNLPSQNNMCEFFDRDAAVSSGYSPCKNCNP